MTIHAVILSPTSCTGHSHLFSLSPIASCSTNSCRTSLDNISSTHPTDSRSFPPLTTLSNATVLPPYPESPVNKRYVPQRQHICRQSKREREREGLRATRRRMASTDHDAASPQRGGRRKGLRSAWQLSLGSRQVQESVMANTSNEVLQDRGRPLPRGFNKQRLTPPPLVTTPGSS